MNLKVYVSNYYFFDIITDKYYLCDGAYINIRRFLSPFHNTRYWLADFLCQRALTTKEKLNHAMTQLIKYYRAHLRGYESTISNSKVDDSLLFHGCKKI